MKNLGTYLRKFAIGACIGLGVYAGMTLFGVAGIVLFTSPNPLTNALYAAVFFGVIQTSGAIMNDLFSTDAWGPNNHIHDAAHQRLLNQERGLPNHQRTQNFSDKIASKDAQSFAERIQSELPSEHVR